DRPQTVAAWRRRSPTVSDNPVFWREIRRPLVTRRWQAIAMATLIGGVLVFFYVCMAINTELGNRNWQMPFACIFCGLLTLLACIISATAIAQEKESDTWTLLLSSPLTSRQIVLGKLAGLLRRLLWPSILIVLHFLLFGLGGVLNWTTVWVILYLTFSTNIIWVATGLYFSLRLKTVTFAIILNLCVTAALYGLAPILLGITGVFFYRTDTGAEIVGLYVPYAYMCSAIESLNDRHNGYNYNYNAQFTRTDNLLARKLWVPVFGQIRATDFLAIVFVVGLAYLLLTTLVVWYTIRSFNNIVGRAGQLDRQANQLDTLTSAEPLAM
ncbi:MAG: ABC transporter permease subunit, partial [Planctomycetota bacterium]|nr:ABC transporter permease subunit [Planctomycetota bacterium]